MQATGVLRKDHQTVKGLFSEFERTPRQDGRSRQELMDRIAEELEIHTKIEEEIFYPALSSLSGVIEEARHEHREATRLIGDIEGRDPASGEFEAGVRQLAQAIEHHVTEEEGRMFQDAQRLGRDALDRLGQQLEQRKQELRTSIAQRGLRAVKQAARKIA